MLTSNESHFLTTEITERYNFRLMIVDCRLHRSHLAPDNKALKSQKSEVRVQSIGDRCFCIFNLQFRNSDPMLHAPCYAFTNLQAEI